VTVELETPFLLVVKWLNGEKREGEEKKEDREVVAVVAGLSCESLAHQTREDGGRCILSCMLYRTEINSHHGHAG